MTGSTAGSGELIDTNILIYAHDPGTGARHLPALELLERLIQQRRLVLSAQVLNEFYSAATRPHRPPSLPHSIAREKVETLAASAQVLPLTSGVTLRALEAVSRHGMSFWDALIWAAAREHGVAVLHSEDFQHGRVVEGVRFNNPFLTP